MYRRNMISLSPLPGVGRKTANVVVSNAFGVPAIAVDTHVERVSKRLGLAGWDDSVLEVEKKLMKRVPRDEWTITHHRFIFLTLPLQGSKSPMSYLSALRHMQGREKRMKTSQIRKDKENVTTPKRKLNS